VGPLNQPGVPLNQTGEHQGAESILRQALAIRNDLHGKQHLQVARSLLNPAGFLQSRDQFREAEDLLRQALPSCQNVFPVNDILLIPVEGKLEECFVLQGKYSEAETLLTRSFMVRQNLQGNNHTALSKQYTESLTFAPPSNNLTK